MELGTSQASRQSHVKRKPRVSRCSRVSKQHLNYLYSIVPSQDMEASENPSLQTVGPDPMLFRTASKKNRFYIFSSRKPDLR